MSVLKGMCVSSTKNHRYFFTPSYGDNNTVIELQPHINVHNPIDHELSPPPCYSPPPSYQPPPYSDLLARDLITQSSPDGGPVQTTLAPNDGQFIARCGSPIPGNVLLAFNDQT